MPVEGARPSITLSLIRVLPVLLRNLPVFSNSVIAVL